MLIVLKPILNAVWAVRSRKFKCSLMITNVCKNPEGGALTGILVTTKREHHTEFPISYYFGQIQRDYGIFKDI